MFVTGWTDYRSQRKRPKTEKQINPLKKKKKTEKLDPCKRFIKGVSRKKTLLLLAPYLRDCKNNPCYKSPHGKIIKKKKKKQQPRSHATNSQNLSECLTTFHPLSPHTFHGYSTMSSLQTTRHKAAVRRERTNTPAPGKEVELGRGTSFASAKLWRVFFPLTPRLRHAWPACRSSAPAWTRHALLLGCLRFCGSSPVWDSLEPTPPRSLVPREPVGSAARRSRGSPKQQQHEPSVRPSSAVAAERRRRGPTRSAPIRL